MKNVQLLPFVKITALVMVFVFYCKAIAAAPQDGSYYYEQMKAAMIEVVQENQQKINANPDHSVKNSDLTPQNFYGRFLKMLPRVSSGQFSFAELSRENDPARIAHMLAAMVEAGGIVIARSQDAIDQEADGRVVLKKFIPPVFGSLIAKKFEEKTGIVIKQTTLGKNGYMARNGQNAPVDWERDFLEGLSRQDWISINGIGERTEKEFHYIKPIYVKNACLGCHGEPAGKRDFYGHHKEGYARREVRGAISVVIPL